jgi:hypothetical protein
MSERKNTAVGTLFAAVLACGAADAQVAVWCNGPTAVAVVPGAAASFSMTALNYGAAPDTLSCATTEGFLVGAPLGQTLAPGQSVVFGLDVVVAPDAFPGPGTTPTLSWWTGGGAADSLTFSVDVELPTPSVFAYQPAGPGGATAIAAVGAYAGYDYRNVFSFEPAAGGPGTGPYLGLCASNVDVLVVQLLVGPNTPPFTFTGASTDGSVVVPLGLYGLPAGATFEHLVLFPRLYSGPNDPIFQWSYVSSMTVQ